MCYIYPCANVNVEEIHGSVVIVDPAFDRSWLNGIKMDVEAKDLMRNEVCRKVRIDVIEADDVVIDHCDCRRISANNVVIGANTKIDYLEYHDRCDIHKQALVKEIVKL